MNPSTIKSCFPDAPYIGQMRQPAMLAYQRVYWTSHEGIFHLEKRHIIIEHTTGWGYVSSQEGTFLHQMLYWTGNKERCLSISHFLFQVPVGKIRVSGNFHWSSPSEIRAAFFQPKNTHCLKSSCSTSITRAIHVWYIYLQLGWLYGFHVGAYVYMHAMGYYLYAFRG